MSIQLSNDNDTRVHQPWRGTLGQGHVRLEESYDESESVHKIAMLRWDTDTLSWVKFSGDADGIAANVTVLNFPATFPITATSLPLPTGAATEVTLASIDSALGSIDFATETTLASVESFLTTIESNQLPNNHDVTVTNFPATQPISGTVSVSNFPATQPISAVSLPLPTGAATETTLHNVDTILTQIEGNQLPNDHDVNVTNFPSLQSIQGELPVGSATSGTNPIVVGFQDVFGNIAIPTGVTAGAFTVLGTIAVDLTGTPISFATGAQVTAANQTEGAAFTAAQSHNMIGAVRRDTRSAGTGVDDGDVGSLSIASNGELYVRDTAAITNLDTISQFIKDQATTSTVTSVSASASSVTLLSANSSRQGAIFYNDSTSDCYLKLGATASTSSFSVKMIPNSTFVLELFPIYIGVVDAIWDTATGSMRITEIG